MTPIEFDGKTYALRLAERVGRCHGCAFKERGCMDLPTDECVNHLDMVWQKVFPLPAFGCDSEVKGGALCDVWCGDRSSCIHSGY